MSNYFLNSFIIMFSLLQIEVPQLPDQAGEISPYNGLAYGALIALLLVINWLTYKTGKDTEASAKEKDAKMLEFNSKIVELMIKIEIKLDDVHSVAPKFTELFNETKELYKEIKDLKHTLEIKLK